MKYHDDRLNANNTNNISLFTINKFSYLTGKMTLQNIHGYTLYLKEVTNETN